MPEKNTVVYLDGIRGVAAFFVFLNHFCLAFYPAYFNFKPEMSHLNGAELYYQKSLFSFITNGGFQVAIFFILSGYVLSRKYLQSGDLQIPVSGLHRRFLRLWIPVAFTIIVSYLLLKANLITNHVSSHITLSDWFDRQWRFSEPGIRLFKSLIYGTMFAGDASFDTCLWTISYEFYGSLFIFSFLVFTHFIPRYRLLMMFLCLFYFYLSHSPFYMSFVLGMTLCYTEQWMKGKYGLISTVIAYGLLLAGLTMGSVPFSAPFANTMQYNFKVLYWDYTPWAFTIGAYSLVLAFVLSPFLQKLISFKLFRFMGSISFSLYLIHPLIIGSFSSSLFMNLYNSRMLYNNSTLIVGLGTVILLIPVSWLMTKYIDRPAIIVAKKVYELLSTKEKKLIKTDSSS